jgi:hypothetical protein
MESDVEWNGEILKELSPEWGERVIFLPECGSTNDEARKLAFKGAPNHSVNVRPPGAVGEDNLGCVQKVKG